MLIHKQGERIMLTVEQRVQRGVALMDLLAPEGWREWIDCDHLDMSKASWCILGQVYVSYWYAPRSFSDFDLADYGFTTNGTKYSYAPWAVYEDDEDYYCSECNSNDAPDFNALTSEWRKVLS
jgi:hypothetical protein